MPDPAPHLQTRQSLLLRLKDHRDEKAWQLFTEIYAPLVHGYCRRQGMQEADAADVAQEVMAQVSRSITSFEYRPEKGKFRNWFGAVVRSKVLRLRQKQARGAQASGGADPDPVIDGAPAPEADSEWEAQFNAHVVRVALERVRPDFEAHNWRAFEMVWLEDRPAAEVAKELGMPPNTVYVAKSRVLKRLREEVLALAEDIPHLIPG